MKIAQKANVQLNDNVKCFQHFNSILIAICKLEYVTYRSNTRAGMAEI